MKQTELIGKVVKIIEMHNEPNYVGKIGIVEFVDDANQLHGTWGNLAIIPSIDKFEVLENTKN
jgi:hypothetical protein